MTSFFVIGNNDPSRNRPALQFVQTEDSALGPAPQCEKCGRFIGLMPLLPPVRVQLAVWGPSWADISVGVGGQILVSERLRDEILQRRFIGLRTFAPVEILSSTSFNPVAVGAMPKYFLADVQRGPAVIDAEESKLRRQSNAVCSVCKVGGNVRGIERIIFEPGSWKGEDFFSAIGLPGTYVVSRRLRDLLMTESFNGCQITPTASYRLDFTS